MQKLYEENGVLYEDIERCKDAYSCLDNKTATYTSSEEYYISDENISFSVRNL